MFARRSAQSRQPLLHTTGRIGNSSAQTGGQAGQKGRDSCVIVCRRAAATCRARGAASPEQPLRGGFRENPTAQPSEWWVHGPQVVVSGSHTVPRGRVHCGSRDAR